MCECVRLRGGGAGVMAGLRLGVCLGVHIQEEEKKIEQSRDLVNWINWQFLSRDCCGITQQSEEHM